MEGWKRPEDVSADVGAGIDASSGHESDREAKMAARS